MLLLNNSCLYFIFEKLWRKKNYNNFFILATSVKSEFLFGKNRNAAFTIAGNNILAHFLFDNATLSLNNNNIIFALLHIFRAQDGFVCFICIH